MTSMMQVHDNTGRPSGWVRPCAVVHVRPGHGQLHLFTGDGPSQGYALDTAENRNALGIPPDTTDSA